MAILCNISVEQKKILADFFSAAAEMNSAQWEIFHCGRSSGRVAAFDEAVRAHDEIVKRAAALFAGEEK